MAMSASSEPMILAEQGALVIAEQGRNVLVIDRGQAPTEVTVLVLTMAALIFGGFGVVSLFYELTGSPSLPSTVIGAALLLVGIAAFRTMLTAGEALRRVRLTPMSAYVPVAVFDRENRLYRDGGGEIVARLDEVRFERHTQRLTVSIVAVTPYGTRVLLSGNVFRGGIGTLDRVLDNAVHGR